MTSLLWFLAAVTTDVARYRKATSKNGGPDSLIAGTWGSRFLDGLLAVLLMLGHRILLVCREPSPGLSLIHI